MERLTERGAHGQAWYLACKDCKNGKYGDYCVNCENRIEHCRRLADYEDAEEQGRLIKLPFAYGNTIFEIESINNRILEWYVYGYDISPGAIYVRVGEYAELNIAHVGETIFRTWAEAEAKLKEMEADNHGDI